MNLSGGSATGIAGAVWTNATRSLTNTGPAFTGPNAAFSTIAGNAVIDLRCAASHVGEITISVAPGVGATAVLAVQAYDGTNIINQVQSSGGAGTSASFHTVNTSAVGPRISNFDATHAGNYMYSAELWTL